MFKMGKPSEIADEVSRVAQLASILEVCTYPKPGTVHRFYDFKDTKFEHFIASGVAIGPIIREASIKGLLVDCGKLGLSEVGVGRYIRKCIVESGRWHHGGNTNLGIVTLLVPLAVGAALSRSKHEKIKARLLRQKVRETMESTTVDDSINFYDAVRSADFSCLGRISPKSAPDVTSKFAIRELSQKNITLYKVMKVCSPWDNICKEWITGMRITFKLGYPVIKTVYRETRDLNTAIAQCFLTILANYPDSLIARKNGMEIAKKISQKAQKILVNGGNLTDEGRNEAERFDEQLHTPDNRLNPGTTADLTASSIMVSLLCGIRP